MLSNRWIALPSSLVANPRETSLQIDTDKVSAAREVLGTKTMTDTVDAALAEVVSLRQRRQLVELLFNSGALDGPETMTGAWR